MDKEMFRQGSTRCFDFTAFSALRNIEKEERKMNNKTGEIWNIEMSNGNIREALVVKDNGDSCIILLLTDTSNSSCDIEVNCRGRMYTSSKRIQYCFEDKFGNFIRKLTNAEFKDVQVKVADSIGIKPKEVLVGKPSDDEHELKKMLADTKKRQIILQPQDGNVELERIKAKLEVYKDLYTELLQNTMKGAI